jgi:succinate dehydrogenase/fumarate reductase cytochrome b subunit
MIFYILNIYLSQTSYKVLFFLEKNTANSESTHPFVSLLKGYILAAFFIFVFNGVKLLIFNKHSSLLKQLAE